MVIITSCFTEALDDLEALDLRIDAEALDLCAEFRLELAPPRMGDHLMFRSASSMAAVDSRGDLLWASWGDRLNDALADLALFREALGDTLRDDL